MSKAEDTLAERLRRRPAKPMGSPRVGSNPTGVVCTKEKGKEHQHKYEKNGRRIGEAKEEII